MNDNKTLNTLAILAIVVVAISFVNIVATIVKVSIYTKEVTGFAATGYVNLTVIQNVVLNVSRDRINFGSGVINTTDGCQNATLYTQGDSDPHIECGNWTITGGARGIIVQNLGSVNFSLNLSASKNAVDFFGGTNPSYQWNLSNLDPETCNTINNGTNFNQSYFFEVEKDTQYNVCKQFGYNPNHQMYFDAFVRIPADNNITDGNPRWDTITITAYAAW